MSESRRVIVFWLIDLLGAKVEGELLRDSLHSLCRGCGEWYWSVDGKCAG